MRVEFCVRAYLRHPAARSRLPLRAALLRLLDCVCCEDYAVHPKLLVQGWYLRRVRVSCRRLFACTTQRFTRDLCDVVVEGR